jgi:nicotinamidase-related amidase
MTGDLCKKAWQKGMDKLIKAVQDFDIDPSNIALLIVDMQYYDAHPDYGIGKNLKTNKSKEETANYYFSWLKVVVPNCAKLIDFFRKNKLRIFHAAYGASMRDGSDVHPMRKMKGEAPAYTTEDFEYQILDELKPEPGELLVSKVTRNAFVGTCLDHKMRMIGIDTVVVVGAATEVCVASTARGAWDCGYKVILKRCIRRI